MWPSNSVPRLRARKEFCSRAKAQEKCRGYWTEKRRNPRTRAAYAWIVKPSALINHDYFCCVDRDFWPFFLKFCSYLPYNGKLRFDGHEYAKRQLERKRIDYAALDNGVLSCAKPSGCRP